jgi:hypothetical protein
MSPDARQPPRGEGRSAGPGRPVRYALALLFLVFSVYLVLKEIREPHLALYLDDLLHPKPLPITLPLLDDLEVRLYADTRPHCGKVARLQKGLVLVVDGRERIEEGFGLGLPIVEAGGEAYLSRHASVSQTANTLVKHYAMDTLDTPSGFLRRKYEPVPSLGTVVVSYTVTSGDILVRADFSSLNVPWERAYLMNEQGARFFTRYEEPGLVVEGAELGIWHPTVAETGCIVAANGSVRFCVETDGPAARYYGRERYCQYYFLGFYVLSWAGIDLEIDAPHQQFEYQVTLERQKRD